jgi:hypothetical protein
MMVTLLLSESSPLYEKFPVGLPRAEATPNSYDIRALNKQIIHVNQMNIQRADFEFMKDCMGLKYFSFERDTDF